MRGKFLFKFMITSAALLCVAVLSVRASEDGSVYSGVGSRMVAIGTIHSFKGVGLCAELEHNERTFSSLAFTADLIDILNGKSSTPGLKLTYHCNMVLRTWDHGHYEFYAGPGFTFGRVRNTDNRFGYMAGVSGDVGFRVKCLKSIVIGAELQADFSLLFKNRYWPDMSLYKAGFCNSYWPHLRIQHSF